IRAEKIEGPKILGKIQLPVDSDTRPKAQTDEKRKRKRIPIEKKEIRPQAFRDRPAGQTGGGQSQGGGGRIQIQRNPGGAQGGNRFGPNRGRDNRREDKQIDEKEIQRKIQET